MIELKIKRPSAIELRESIWSNQPNLYINLNLAAIRGDTQKGGERGEANKREKPIHQQQERREKE
jgi:hypothetical protein